MSRNHGAAPSVRKRPGRHTSGRMAATNPRSTGRPSRRAVVVAFGIAIGAAVALVALALLLRSDQSTPPATATPIVDLGGIPQRGGVLGSPSATVRLIEYADPQCPACRLTPRSIFPTVVNEYVRPGKVDTEFRGFPFIGDRTPSRATASSWPRPSRTSSGISQEAMYRNQGAENSGWITDDLVRRARGRRSPGSTSRSSSPTPEAPDDRRRRRRGRSREGASRRYPGHPDVARQGRRPGSLLIQVATVEQLRAALDDALAG